MKKKLNYKPLLDKVNQLLFLTIFAFPLFPIRINGYIVLLFFLSSLINYIVLRPKLTRPKPVFYLAIAFPLLYFISFLITPDSAYARFDLEKRVLLFFAPIMFWISNIKLKEKYLLEFFNGISSFLAIEILGYLFIKGTNPIYNIGGSAYAIRTTVEDLTGIHPTYLSMVLAFSALVIFYNILRYKEYRIIRLLQLGLLIVTIMLLSSKMVIIAMFIIAPIILFKSKLSTKLKLLGSLTVGIIAFFAIAFIPSLNSRMLELKSSFNGIPTEIEANATNSRLGIYHCSLEVIKQNFLFGAGGELQNKLNDCYGDIGINRLHKESFNTHNEYFNIFAGLGIFGITIFLLLIMLSFKSVKSDPYHLIFLGLFCLICLTENLLSRQQGIFFFALFNYYFLFGRKTSNNIDF